MKHGTVTRRVLEGIPMRRDEKFETRIFCQSIE